MNKDKPKITVYITNHNYGRFIREAVESVFNQSYTDWELIIIDDGSIDDSHSIIEQYRNRPRVKIIYQKNKGLNVTNNIALRVAEGEFIMRLDADDYLDHNALLVLSNKLLADSDLGMVFPDYFLVDVVGNILNVERRNSFKKDVSLLDQPAHGACTMIRKSFLESVGGYDEEFGCQDGYELWVKFIARYKVENVETPLFYYRQHGKNLTTNESRILRTRASIKEKFIGRGIAIPSTMAIIPIRGIQSSSHQLALQEIGGKSIIRWKLDEVLKSKNISKVIVTCPDAHLDQYIKEFYPNQDRIIFHHRSATLAQLNIGLSSTIESLLNKWPVKDVIPELLLILSIEYPFSNASDFDDAINTLVIFDSDSLISVRKDNNVYYQHHGGGMQSVLGMDKFSKLEREMLYQYAGGIILTKRSSFHETNDLISGKVGHTVISQKSSFRIQTDFDLELAKRMVDL